MNGELEKRVLERTAELRESRELFRTLATVAPVGIYRTDSEGRCLYVNERWCEITGLTQQRAIGNSWEEAVHPEDRRRVQAEWEQSLTRDVPFRSEYRIQRPDGAVSSVLTQGVAEKYDDGKEPCYVGTITDITERKNLEEQLHQSQKMEAIGRLAGGVAHDFNNLLMVIKGYSELPLSKMNREDPLRKNLEEIQRAADRAASLTQQLLSFSREAVLERRVLDLNPIVMDVERMLGRLIGEDIDLMTVPAVKLGKVKANPGKLEQILLNLAVNARDAMPRGGKLTIETANVDLGEIYVRQHTGVPPGSYVMLAVSDTGNGMDAETQSRIFEPFFTTKDRGKGTGLGLSTVYGIVKQSGGYVWVYSEPGRGSTFKIYLPRVEEIAESPAAGAVPVGLAGGTETVLIVEDEAPVRRLARDFLELNGYRVLEASDGKDALRFGREHGGPIHALVTDIVMPGMSGLELARRHLSLHPKSKVLYMSGYTDDSLVRQNGFEQDAVFLQKPFSMETLARRLRDLLDGRGEITVRSSSPTP